MTEFENKDRFLVRRGKKYSYVRRVPADIKDMDTRGPRFKIALRTGDLSAARSLRDKYERIDDELWEALRVAKYASTDQDQYAASLSLHSALGVKHLSESEQNDEAVRLSALDGVHLSPDELYPIRAIERGANVEHPVIEKALQGKIGKPTSRFSSIVEEYIGKLEDDDWQMKSQAQKDMSKKPIKIAAKAFIDCCGDLPVRDIERHHGVKFNDYLRGKLRQRKLGWNACNRQLGNLRQIIKYAQNNSGDIGKPTPFDGFSFSEPRVKSTRPPFSIDFVNKRWLTGDTAALKMKNPSMRNAVFAMMGTGCRPSEILNLQNDCIHLDAEIPYIEIKDRDGRELKTGQSNRELPLYGLALAAFKKQHEHTPDMFDEFFDREANVTTAIGKFMRENPILRETEKHTLYSFRHMCEDLAKDAGLDLELRMELFGHAKERSEYGRGFTLEAKLDGYAKMFADMKFSSELFE